jgi:hypothetical protein
VLLLLEEEEDDDDEAAVLALARRAAADDRRRVDILPAGRVAGDIGGLGRRRAAAADEVAFGAGATLSPPVPVESDFVAMAGGGREKDSSTLERRGWPSRPDRSVDEAGVGGSVGRGIIMGKIVQQQSVRRFVVHVIILTRCQASFVRVARHRRERLRSTKRLGQHELCGCVAISLTAATG